MQEQSLLLPSEEDGRGCLLSGPDAFRGLVLFRSLKNPMLLTWIFGITVSGSGSDKSVLSSVMKTDQKCSFSMFALVLLPQLCS